MTKDENKDYKIRCDVDRSIRYHNLRARFFNAWSNGIEFFAVSALTIILGLASADIMEPYWAFIAMMVWVGGKTLNLAGKARLHENLSREFSEIQSQMVGDYELSAIAERISRVEMNEPPIKRYLDLICYNQVAIVIGSDDVEKLTWWQRWFAQYLNGDSALQ